jgi:hypothetical protein
LRVLQAATVLICVSAERAHEISIQMKKVIRFGLAAIAAGTFFGTTLTGNADTSDATIAFTKHGLPVPGAYFKNNESQQPATIAVSKSGKGVGQEKPTTLKTGKRQPKHAQPVNSGSQLQEGQT